MARPSPLALWHLLSLDAPTVAALWTIFIARSVHLALPWTVPAAMFLAVWMIYVADRLLDSRILLSGHWQTGTLATENVPILEARHRFHHRHRNGFLACMAVAAVVLAVLLPRLDPRTLRLYALLSALLAVWLLLIHIRPLPNDEGLRLPKELAVGIFFSATVFLATISRAPALRMSLLPVGALFAAVCALNGFYIHAWEHSGERPVAHWTTRWSERHLRPLTVAVAALALVTLWLGRERLLPFAASIPAAPVIACALSAMLFLLLHRLRKRLSAIHLRACADLVLLTPLLLLPWQRGTLR
jgi:hypothetical protein